MEFLLAVQFLTIMPVKITGIIDDRRMAKSMAFFSFVGILIGSMAASLQVVLASYFSLQAASLFSIVFLVIITGNLHGDGLMDTADGRLSGRPKEKALEIMRDSRVGAHGVMAGIIDILSKYVVLTQLPAGTQWTALILSVSIGRWAQVYGAAKYPYARMEGGTASFTSYVGYREIVFNSLTIIILTTAIMKLRGFILLGLVLLGIYLMGKYIFRKLGGITGDTLGAMSEAAEVLTLIISFIIFKL